MALVGAALTVGGPAMAADCPNADAGAPVDVTALATAVVCLVNNERTAAGVEQLAPDDRLVTAAHQHARAMVAQNFFSSTGADGSSPADRAARNGYVTSRIVESIAHGTGVLGTPRSIVSAWMADPAQRARVLSPGAAIGAGAAHGTPGRSDASGATYVVDIATPLATAGIAPAAGKTAVVQVVSGTVLVDTPAGARMALRAATGRAAAYRPLAGLASIPMGARVDARRGTVRIHTAADSAGKQQRATVRGGIFRITQRTSGDLTVNLTLVERLASCRVSAKRRTPRQRSLLVSGEGRYRTRGRYATATVRGTRWRTVDSCAGTRVSVLAGIVDVRNLRTGKVSSVRAGRSLLVKRRP